MSTDTNKSSSEIERDVEHTRARMTETLDELKARMSPGQILDEVMGYARETGGGKMMHNLGRTVQDNPAPLLLIGAGVAWMMAAGRPHSEQEPWHRGEDRPGSPDRPYQESPGWGDTAASVGESARQAGEQAAEKISGMASAAAHAGEQVSSTIASMAHATTGVVNDLRDTATRTMHDLRDNAQRTGGSAYRKSRDVGGNVINVLQDQPFVLGALGIALGAALGAALPETQAEDRLMGEASDALKEEASKGYEKAKIVAKKTLDKATDEVQAQGLSTGSAEEVVGELASKAGAVFETARDAAIDEASRQGLTGEPAKNREGRSASSKGSRTGPPSD